MKKQINFWFKNVGIWVETCDSFWVKCGLTRVKVYTTGAKWCKTSMRESVAPTIQRSSSARSPLHPPHRLLYCCKTVEREKTRRSYDY